MADDIHIACQADERFAPDCAVMLHSLLTTNPDEHIEVHFMHNGRLPTVMMDGWRDIVETLGGRWSPLLIPTDELKGFPHVPHYGGHGYSYRLFLHRLLPQLPRILYLDADTLILDRLRPLWETDLGAACLGAITNSLFAHMETRVQQTLGLPGTSSYFNSGVLLLDLERLRASGLGDRVINVVRDGSVPLPWPDQDALNMVLWAHRYVLPPRWNAMNALWQLPRRYLAWSDAEAAAARARPAIVHFVGPFKPRHYRLRHPYRARYFEHLAQTRWKDVPMEGRTLRHILLRPLPLLWQWRIEDTEKCLRHSARQFFNLPGDFRSRLKSAAIRIPWVWRLQHTARRQLRRWRGTEAFDPIQQTLEALAKDRPGTFFIQVGSNDATHGDPLREFVIGRRWHGILIEPVPYVFERLQQSYKDRSGLILENIAIAPNDGVADFYSVAKTDEPLPKWYDQLGSFSLETILNHAPYIPRLKERIVTLKVPTMTFESLCNKHGVNRLDLVHIDAEGYDYEIIKLIDFKRRQPDVLLYEHHHLSAGDRAACSAYVAESGYLLLPIGGDTLCLRWDTLAARPQLGRVWQSLQG